MVGIRYPYMLYCLQNKQIKRTEKMYQNQIKSSKYSILAVYLEISVRPALNQKVTVLIFTNSFYYGATQKLANITYFI